MRLEQEPDRARATPDPGPAQAPRNSSAPRNDVPITWAYSPSWISANFMPEYSTRKPGDQLGLGLEDVERHAVLRGEGRRR